MAFEVAKQADVLIFYKIAKLLDQRAGPWEVMTAKFWRLQCDDSDFF